MSLPLCPRCWFPVDPLEAHRHEGKDWHAKCLILLGAELAGAA